MYKNLLSAEERIILLALLSDEASDDILLEAVRQSTNGRQRCREEMAEISKHCLKTEKASIAKDAAAPAAKNATVPAQITLPKVSVAPPGVVQTKLNKQIVVSLLNHLTRTGPDTAANITRAINGRAGQTSNYLCTLVHRGTLTFDGKNYSKL
jgi:hypothetical protein